MKKASLILTFFIFIFASCKKDSNSSIPSNSQKLHIGDTAYGGNVFYIDSITKHGLVCATTDQSAGAVWDNSSNANYLYNYTPTGATGTAIGTGATNTTKIISVLGSNGVAASLCRNYRGGGFTDWFLPSKDELNELYINSAVVGGLASSSYWSSSEFVSSSNSSAWFQYFFNGNQYYYY